PLCHRHPLREESSPLVVSFLPPLRRNHQQRQQCHHSRGRPHRTRYRSLPDWPGAAGPHRTPRRSSSSPPPPPHPQRPRRPPRPLSRTCPPQRLCRRPPRPPGPEVAWPPPRPPLFADHRLPRDRYRRHCRHYHRLWAGTEPPAACSDSEAWRRQ
ncbi:hypothetical protein EGW08_005872, partial [Elysia chlorotica]